MGVLLTLGICWSRAGWKRPRAMKYPSRGLASGVAGATRSPTSGQYAYVGRGESLVVFDIQNPDQPRQIATLPLPNTVLDVFVSGSLAYVADGEAGLQIVDISNPAKPVRTGGYDTSRRCIAAFSCPAHSPTSRTRQRACRSST